MRMRVLIVGAMALGACADKTETTPDGVKFQVAPLTLPGITNAEYTLTVKNGASDIVWTKADISADNYGDGASSIPYIGPCDASENDNTVTLELQDLYEDGSTEGLTDQFSGVENPDFNNPCPTAEDTANGENGTTGCTLTFECVENADVSVVFNISLMRSAQQGFFDIAVNFEDIFCSAKADCQDELLFQPDGNGGSVRGPTAILAFACTAGENANTSLWLSNITVSCDTDGNATTAPVDYVIDPSAGEGQHGGGEGPLFAVYQGAEQLGNYNKLYWNVAISDYGIDSAGACYLKAIGTASENASGLTPANTTSPYVDFDVLLNPTGGTFTCDNNALNADGSGVNTVYDAVATQICFDYVLTRGANFTASSGTAGCNQ